MTGGAAREAAGALPSAGPRAAPALTGRIRGAARRMSAGFLAVLIASLVAFGWQSFVTQTHIHFVPVAAPHAAGQQLSGTQPTPDRPIDCPICHDAALAGHYLGAGPAWVLAPIVVAAWLFVAAMLVASRRDRSHAWRSRAPPHRAR